MTSALARALFLFYLFPCLSLFCWISSIASRRRVDDLSTGRPVNNLSTTCQRTSRSRSRPLGFNASWLMRLSTERREPEPERPSPLCQNRARPAGVLLRPVSLSTHSLSALSLRPLSLRPALRIPGSDGRSVVASRRAQSDLVAAEPLASAAPVVAAKRVAVLPLLARGARWRRVQRV